MKTSSAAPWTVRWTLRRPISVKTASPVPKKLIYDIMNELSSVRISAPVTIGQVILQDVLHTGVDIIATRNLA